MLLLDAPAPFTVAAQNPIERLTQRRPRGYTLVAAWTRPQRRRSRGDVGDRTFGNSPPSAPSPSPVWTRGGERHGGKAFQHRLPRAAFYRWPAAPPPHDAVAAFLGGSWSSLSLNPLRAVGPSEPSHEVSAGSAYPVLFWGPVSPDNSTASRALGRHAIALGTAAGTIVKETHRCALRSISRSWALASP